MSVEIEMSVPVEDLPPRTSQHDDPQVWAGDYLRDRWGIAATVVSIDYRNATEDVTFGRKGLEEFAATDRWIIIRAVGARPWDSTERGCDHKWMDLTTHDDSHEEWVCSRCGLRRTGEPRR